MNKLEELKKWDKTGANFHKGVELCRKHNIRPDLVNETFRDGASKGNKRLLLQIIKKEIALLSPSGESTTVKTEQDEQKKAKQRAKLAENFGMRNRYPNIKLSEAPDFIKLMFSEALASWNETVEAHDEKLMAAETDEQRFTIMNEVMAAIEANDIAHMELRHFNDTGEILGKHSKYADFVKKGENTESEKSEGNTETENLEEGAPMSDQEKEFRAMDPTSLLMKRNNLRSQISKLKKALESDPDNSEKKAKLAELETAEKLANSILDEK